MPTGVYKRKPKRDRKSYNKARNAAEYAALRADATVYTIYLETQREAARVRRQGRKIEAMAIKIFEAYYVGEYRFENATETAKAKFRKIAETVLYG